jgi:hypothetical protein
LSVAYAIGCRGFGRLKKVPAALKKRRFWLRRVENGRYFGRFVKNARLTRKIRRLEAQHQKNDWDHINRHSLKPPKT